MKSDQITAVVVISGYVRDELKEDFVGLWTLAWHLRRELPGISEKALQELSEDVLRGLLRLGVELGEVDDETGIFLPWDRVGALDRCMREWRSLGRDPNIGEIAWMCEPT